MNYTINWKETTNDKRIHNYFLSNVGKGIIYWMPFKYGKSWYLMTFNRCYSVSMKG